MESKSKSIIYKNIIIPKCKVLNKENTINNKIYNSPTEYIKEKRKILAKNNGYSSYSEYMEAKKLEKININYNNTLYEKQ